MCSTSYVPVFAILCSFTHRDNYLMLITLFCNVLIININLSYHHCNVDNFVKKVKSLKFILLVFIVIFPNF